MCVCWCLSGALKGNISCSSSSFYTLRRDSDDCVCRAAPFLHTAVDDVMLLNVILLEFL